MPLPSQTADCPLAITLLACAKLIASSDSFMSMVGVVNETDALAKIYFQEAPDDLDPDAPPGEERLLCPRPRCIIYTDQYKRTRDGVAEWTGEATVRVGFETTIPASYQGNKLEESMYALNTIGKIAYELEALRDSDVGLGGFWCVQSIDLLDGPSPCDRVNEVEYFWGAHYLLTGRNS